MAERVRKNQKPARALLCLLAIWPAEPEEGKESKSWSVRNYAPRLLDLAAVEGLLPVWARESGKSWERFGRLEQLGRKLARHAVAKADEALARGWEGADPPKIRLSSKTDEGTGLALLTAALIFQKDPGEERRHALEVEAASALFGEIAERVARKRGAFRLWEEAPERFSARHALDSAGFSQEADPGAWAAEALAALEAKELAAGKAPAAAPKKPRGI